MKQETTNPICERINDLISFVYGEASEREAQDFKKHLRECNACASETASFGQIRESIGNWKQQALSGFAVPNVSTDKAQKRSAVVAVTEFFDLSPLWMKGALAFASLLFCLIAVLALGRLRVEQGPNVIASKQDAIYSQRDVDEMVKEAIEKEASSQQSGKENSPLVSNQHIPKSPRKRPSENPPKLARGRHPLTRNEREQLAADLRLVTRGEEEGLDLLGDRINK